MMEELAEQGSQLLPASVNVERLGFNVCWFKGCTFFSVQCGCTTLQDDLL